MLPPLLAVGPAEYWLASVAKGSPWASFLTISFALDLASAGSPVGRDHDLAQRYLLGAGEFLDVLLVVLLQFLGEQGDAGSDELADKAVGNDLFLDPVPEHRDGHPLLCERLSKSAMSFILFSLRIRSIVALT